MQSTDSTLKLTVIWRTNKYTVEMHRDSSVKNLGDELQRLTDVKPDTMRLIVPRVSNKGSNLLSPFSDEDSQLSLQNASIIEGKSIRMMGVSEDEVDKILQNAKVDLRIAGFDEEERRMKQRASYMPYALPKLPQGPYTFCGFRTLELPGIELKPPASEALKRMHMLAADPGIVAIMNKHQWRVGIMTEMAPVGYVGISPKCILGFNKNHGEEISLRLRTDDLKGFRKYDSIKKTLLHELAHMVYSEHDANFYAFDKQLNQEAANLDWTKSGGHTLSSVRHLDDFEEESYSSEKILPQKLGGNASDQMASARASSVAAAYRRLANSAKSAGVEEEPDPDDSQYNVLDRPHAMDCEPHSDSHNRLMETIYVRSELSKTIDEPDPDDLEAKERNLRDGNIHEACKEPDPDESRSMQAEPDPDDDLTPQAIFAMRKDEMMTVDEPDPDESEQKQINSGYENMNGPDQIKPYREPDPDESQANIVAQAEPKPDDALVPSLASSMTIDEPDPDDEELRRIQDSATVICGRLQKAIESLRSKVNPTEASAALQTVTKIVRNVIEHPNESKFKRLRKANPMFQKNVGNHKAAMEILQIVGFMEDVVFNKTGKQETYLVLKRNDPGLLWLAKSSLEACAAS